MFPSILIQLENGPKNWVWRVCKTKNRKTLALTASVDFSCCFAVTAVNLEEICVHKLN